MLYISSSHYTQVDVITIIICVACFIMRSLAACEFVMVFFSGRCAVHLRRSDWHHSHGHENKHTLASCQRRRRPRPKIHTHVPSQTNIHPIAHMCNVRVCTAHTHSTFAWHCTHIRELWRHGDIYASMFCHATRGRCIISILYTRLCAGWFNNNFLTELSSKLCKMGTRSFVQFEVDV